jgi:filamentous hemagglutinin family protein
MNSNGLNHFFRIVWNASKGAWQAVSEIAKGQGKSKSSKTARSALTAGSFVLLTATALMALGRADAAEVLPTGGSVTAGSATISTSGSAMTINQTTAKMAADWQSFSIGQGNTVTFNQPSASSVALNRVLGADVSVIQGALRANGQVFLINPNGVLFTPTAQVNVGAMVASTLHMKTEDFMAGDYRFDGSMGAAIKGSAVINQGNISATGEAGMGGTIALIAAKVTNTGRLNANQGNVLLGAGNKVTLDMGGPVKLIVEQGAIDALIESGGAMKADGGVVLLTARAAGDLAASVINHTGMIEASSLSEKGGKVVLEADRITLADGSKIEAKGASAGGEVLVGGSWQNSDPAVRQATQTKVAAGAVIDASATQRGDGGTVVVWSDTSKADSVTTVRGTLVSKGGALGGNGGRVETSGYLVDTAGASVSASAAKGNGGLWLIDPTDATIDQTVANGYVATLNGGTSVLNTVGGTMTVSNNVSMAKTSGSAATLTLQSTGSGYINIGTGVTISDTVSTPLNVVLETAGPVLFADNGSAVNSVNIHGNLTIGAAGSGYATGNAGYGASYKDGVHIGNYVQLSAADIAIKGKGFDYTSYTGQQLAGGTGVYVGTSAHVVGTGNITVTGQGGAGSRASDGANAGNMSQSQSSYPANTFYNNAANAYPGTATGNAAYGSSGASANGSTGSTGNAGGDASANAGAGGVGVEILSSAIVHADLNLTMSGSGGAGGNGGNGGIGGQGLIGQQAGTAQGGQYAQGSTVYDSSWYSVSYVSCYSCTPDYGWVNGSYVFLGTYSNQYSSDSASNPHGGYYNGAGSNAYGGSGGNAIGGTGGTGGRGGYGSAGAIGGTGVKVTQATVEALQTLSVTATSGTGGTGGSGNTGGQGGTGGAAGTAGSGGSASSGQNYYSNYWGSQSSGSGGSAYQGSGGTGGVGGNAGAGGSATGKASATSGNSSPSA